MASLIPIEAIPNQSFSIILDQRRYEIALKTIADGMTCIDITCDSVIVLQGQRVLPNVPIIPYEYVAATTSGNFMIEDNTTEDYPFYTAFGVTQFLMYSSAEEIGANLES